jgi:hypothetical protein
VWPPEAGNFDFLARLWRRIFRQSCGGVFQIGAQGIITALFKLMRVIEIKGEIPAKSPGEGCRLKILGLS